MTFTCPDCGHEAECPDVLGAMGLHGAGCDWWNHLAYHCPGGMDADERHEAEQREIVTERLTRFLADAPSEPA